jgi:hypothetical protein
LDDGQRAEVPATAAGEAGPAHNPKAVAGYYVSWLSLIVPLGLALGPAALVLGICGLRRRSRRPEAGGRADSVFSVVAGSLVTAAYLVAVILIAVKLAS